MGPNPKQSPAQRVCFGKEEQGSGRSFGRFGGRSGGKRTLRRRGPGGRLRRKGLPGHPGAAAVSPLLHPFQHFSCTFLLPRRQILSFFLHSLFPHFVPVKKLEISCKLIACNGFPHYPQSFPHVLCQAVESPLPTLVNIRNVKGKFLHEMNNFVSARYDAHP